MTSSLLVLPKSISLIALGLAAVLALSGCAPADKPEPVNEEIEEKPEARPYASTILHGEELTKEFEIPTGLSDQELGETFAESINAWENYGANPSLEAEVLGKGLGDDEKLAIYSDLAEKNADAIAPAILGDDWGNHPVSSQLKRQLQENNSVTLNLNALTSDKEYDEESWATYIEDVITTNISDEFTLEGGRRLRIEYVVKDNSDKNRVDKLTQVEQYPAEGKLTVIEATFIEVDGKTVAVEIDYGPHLYQ